MRPHGCYAQAQDFWKNAVKQLCHVLSHSCIPFGLISFVFGMVDLSVSQELDFRDFHRPSKYNVDEETQVRSYLRVISEVINFMHPWLQPLYERL